MALNIQGADLVPAAFDDIHRRPTHDPVDAVFIGRRVTCTEGIGRRSVTLRISNYLMLVGPRSPSCAYQPKRAKHVSSDT